MAEPFWVVTAATIAVLMPGAAALLLGARLMAEWTPSERWTDDVARWSLSLSLVATLAAAAAMLASGDHQVVVHLGTWFSLPGYGFEFDLLVDELAVPMMLLSSSLVGLVGMFSMKYLHRQPGYHRFFFLMFLFGAGMMLVSAAGTLDVLFVGWELVGLSSTLLIAYYWDRRGPVEGGLRALATYRLCDVGLLTAAALMHHQLGTASFVQLFGSPPWPEVASRPELAPHATLLGLLLVLASMGKSAQVPTTGWLPLAMEGPTPSSAIFYGALSVHAGAFLLLRCSPFFEASLTASTALAAVGAVTFFHASRVGRVQSKGKNLLAYSSAAQLGLIFVEIALGFRYLALVHILGHATLRTLQLLRAPSMLEDYHQVEGMTPGTSPHPARHLEAALSPERQRRLYRLSLERGYLDATLRRFLVEPILAAGRLVDGLERLLAEALGGREGEESR